MLEEQFRDELDILPKESSLNRGVTPKIVKYGEKTEILKTLYLDKLGC